MLCPILKKFQNFEIHSSDIPLWFSGSLIWWTILIVRSFWRPSDLTGHFSTRFTFRRCPKFLSTANTMNARRERLTGSNAPGRIKSLSQKKDRPHQDRSRPAAAAGPGISSRPLLVQPAAGIIDCADPGSSLQYVYSIYPDAGPQFCISLIPEAMLHTLRRIILSRSLSG